MSAAVATPGVAARLWAAYLRQLNARPLRTKMITSASLFTLGDTMAQFGIEGRSIKGRPATDDEEEVYPYDPIRATRLMFYGGFIFAPLAHTWLVNLEKVHYASKAKTLVTRLALDQFIWGPFIVFTFWTANGFLEGKTVAQVKDKVSMAFVSSYKKSLCVFGPTAAFNFSLVPMQHRLMVAQTVGLGWNCYLSYVNNINNKRLLAAAAALATAHEHAEAEGSEVNHVMVHDPSAPVAEELKAAAAELEKAKKKKQKIRDGEGGGATGVGTRMGY